jgi:hypothetical protein
MYANHIHRHKHYQTSFYVSAGGVSVYPSSTAATSKSSFSRTLNAPVKPLVTYEMRKILLTPGQGSPNAAFKSTLNTGSNK